MHKLMVKTHNVTGLKYLCYTQKDDHDSYTGSGKYWKRHIKEHGYDVTTTIIFQTEEYEDFVDKAREVSCDYDVVSSHEWANLRIEEGTGGDTVSNKIWITDGSCDMYIDKQDDIPVGWTKGRSNTKFNDAEFQKEMSRRRHSKQLDPSIMKEAARKATATKRERNSFADISGDNNPAKRDDVKLKLSEAAKNRPNITCPHCGKIGKQSPGMYRFHFDNCRKV